MGPVKTRGAWKEEQKMARWEKMVLQEKRDLEEKA
jgi:hypothetical protein